MTTTSDKRVVQPQAEAKGPLAGVSGERTEKREEQQTERLPTVQTDKQPISVPRTTRVLLPSRTRPLESGITSTTGRQVTRIPGSGKIPPREKKPKKRSPLVLIGVCLGIVVILSFSAFFVDPLDSSAQFSNFGQTLNSFFHGSDVNVVQLPQRLASPTAIVALQTNEGYCGGYDIWGTCAKALTPDGTVGTGVMQKPIDGARITQVFANPEYQFWCGCVKPHSGIDLAAAYGTPVMAADSGEVIWVGWDWSGLGNAVKISHGNYIATIYGHLARYIVQVGEDVSKGQVIAYEGSTGASTGPHVHFMVMVNNKWVDPTLYMSLP
jgi:Peptidase family M23